jgi:hypothetical protein
MSVGVPPAAHSGKIDDTNRVALSEEVEPAFKAEGHMPLRIDLKEHNEKIWDEILAEIGRAGLLPADLTGSGSVFISRQGSPWGPANL